MAQWYALGAGWLIIMTLIIGGAEAKLIEVGPNYELHEEDGNYTMTSYSYLKYFPKEGGSYFKEWEMINENFQTQNCKNFYNYCQDTENYYKVHVKNSLTKEQTIAFETKEDTVYIELLEFNLDGNNIYIPWTAPTVINNTMRFEILKDKYWFEYTYLPDKLKDSYFINDENVKKLNFKGIEIILKKTETNKYAFISENFTICDYNERYCEVLPVKVDGDEIHIFVQPLKWFPDAELPLVIDPEISLTSFVNLTTNGYVWKDTGTSLWTRVTNPRGRANLNIGTAQTPPAISFNRFYRSWMRFRLDPLPAGAIVTNASLQFYVAAIDDKYPNLQITELEGYDNFYANNNASNFLFWHDMHNGTNYTFVNVSDMGTGKEILNLYNATSDIQSQFDIGQNFSFSLNHDKLFQGGASKFTQIRPRDYGTAAERPVLNITYRFACDPPKDREWWINVTCIFDNEVVENGAFGAHIDIGGRVYLENSAEVILGYTLYIAANDAIRRLFIDPTSQFSIET